MVRNNIDHEVMARRINEALALMVDLSQLVSVRSLAFAALQGITDLLEVVREHMDNLYRREHMDNLYRVDAEKDYDVRLYYPKGDE